MSNPYAFLNRGKAPGATTAPPKPAAGEVAPDAHSALDTLMSAQPEQPPHHPVHSQSTPVVGSTNNPWKSSPYGMVIPTATPPPSATAPHRAVESHAQPHADPSDYFTRVLGKKAQGVLEDLGKRADEIMNKRNQHKAQRAEATAAAAQQIPPVVVAPSSTATVTTTAPPVMSAPPPVVVGPPAAGVSLTSSTTSATLPSSAAASNAMALVQKQNE